MSASVIIRLTIYSFAGLILVGSAGLTMSFFLGFRPDIGNIERREPIDRNRAARVFVPVEGTITPGPGIASPISATWSQFRGDNSDAISTETLALRRDWTNDNPPPTLWELPLGEGYAGFAVANGCVYIMDYDEENQRDALRCLSLDDGREIWRLSYPIAIKRNHGMSRTIPAVTEQYCAAIGPKCHAMSVCALTGEKKWLIDMRYVYGTIEPDWYAGQCPLIAVLPGRDRPSVILAPVGPEVLMVALDCETGDEVWQTPNLFYWNMTHTSIVPMMLEDQLTFVYFGDDGLVGVRAEDGAILWSLTGWPTALATCPSPLILSAGPDDLGRIFFAGGYNRGSAMIQIVSTPQGQYEARMLFQLEHPVFDSEQQTPIYYDGHIFGLRQRDKRFICLDVHGNVVWESSRRDRFGSGPYIVADGMILIVDDEGVLSGIRATPSGFHRYFEVEIMDDYACWAPMAIVQGRLLLRDQMSMKCIDLRE